MRAPDGRCRSTSRRRPRADPRGGAGVVRRLPGRILAAPRPRARLSDRVRRRADQGRLPRRADPGGVWRQRPHHDGGHRHHGGDSGRRLQRRRLPCPDVYDGHPAAPRQRRAEGALAAAASRRASCGCRRSASPSRARAPTRSICAPPRCARAITISSTARRSGPRAPSIPICCCCSRAPRRASRRSAAPKVSRSFSSTCVWPKAPASSSIRSAP